MLCPLIQGCSNIKVTLETSLHIFLARYLLRKLELETNFNENAFPNLENIAP